LKKQSDEVVDLEPPSSKWHPAVLSMKIGRVAKEARTKKSRRAQNTSK